MWFVLLACFGSTAPSPVDPTQSTLDALRSRPLELTRHAECRMGCRQVDLGEVQEILATGTLQPERTRTDGQCPSHALEGRSSDGQELRVVFAECPEETRVVTVIDLGKEWECDCE